MSKATAYTLSLIQKAKEVASNNKILKRQRRSHRRNGGEVEGGLQ